MSGESPEVEAARIAVAQVLGFIVEALDPAGRRHDLPEFDGREFVGMGPTELAQAGAATVEIYAHAVQDAEVGQS